MATCGAFTVVFNDKGQVLLVKRRDWPLWDLPGGRIEAGESPQTAALREAREESGLALALVSPARIYENQALDDRQFVFQGQIVGGQLLKTGPETRRTAYFDTEHLPRLMVPHRRRQIFDCLNATDFSKIQLLVDPWWLKPFCQR